VTGVSVVMALMGACTTRIVLCIGLMLMLMMLLVRRFLRAFRLAGMAARTCVIEFSVHRRPPWP
jgi:hypothetical protein